MVIWGEIVKGVPLEWGEVEGGPITRSRNFYKNFALPLLTLRFGLERTY